MAYLFSEILGSLFVVAVVAFGLGWVLRGLKEKTGKHNAGMIKDDPVEHNRET